MGKILLLTLNEQEETAIDKIIAAIAGNCPHTDTDIVVPQIK